MRVKRADRPRSGLMGEALGSDDRKGGYPAMPGSGGCLRAALSPPLHQGMLRCGDQGN